MPATETGTARRLLIFALLGPPLGLGVGLLAARAGGPLTVDSAVGFLVLAPLAYFFGAVPALCAGLIDDVLARRGIRGRLVWTTLAGGVAGFLPVIAAIGHAGLFRPAVLLWSLIGAIPAATCSAIAARGRPPAGETPLSIPGERPPS